MTERARCEVVDASQSGQNVLDVLMERGFVKDVSDQAGLRGILSEPATVYYGCDATAVSFHVGNQVGMMTMAWLQNFGHRPIALMGGGTTMVGDPSGRTSERPIMSREAIAVNAERLKLQFGRFVDFENGATLLDNSEWLLQLNLVEFLRDVGSKFTVNHMLAHETYRIRLEQGGLSFLEFSYQLLQAYDFLHLYRTGGCRFQIGGSDQWANILAGVDLIRRSESVEAFALVWPLVTTSSGAKMGKTAAGAVWLDPDLLSPYEYYQFWVNTEDADVERFLALFTFLPMDEVHRLGRREGADLRESKEVLAFEVTNIVHGEDAAIAARQTSRALFSGEGVPEAAPRFEIDRANLESGLKVLDLAVRSGLYPSKREAMRQLTAGGLYISNRRVESADEMVTAADLNPSGELVLRSGKKKYLIVEAINY